MKRFWLMLTVFWSGILEAFNESVAIPQGVLIRAGLDTEFVARCALFLALLLIGTVLSGKLLKRFLRMPVIAGQIIGGVILGPSFINIAGFHFFAEPLHIVDQLTGDMYTLISSDLFIFFILLLSSVLTVSYLLWIAGHETDIQDIVKVGVTATSAGILGALMPIFMTVGVIAWLLSTYFTLVQAVGFGVILAATSVSIPVAMLVSYNKMYLKSSQASLGAAIIDDIFAVVLLSLFFIFVQAGMFGECPGIICPTELGKATVSEALVYMILAFAILFFTGYFIVPLILRWLKRHRYSYLIASAANGIMLLYFAGAELIGGLAGITGAYFAGLFHRMGDKKHRAEKTISPFVNAVLLPLFLGSIGLNVNIMQLSAFQWGIVIILLSIAIISKLLGCWLSTGLSNISGRRSTEKWSLLETYLFGSSMVARGEVGLVVATILNGAQIITPHQYVIAVVVIVLTTIASPVMLSLGFNRLELIEKRPGEYSLNLGLFKMIGTAQMFSIIVTRIESEFGANTSIRISEGRRIVHWEKEQVELVLSPEEGITIKASRDKVQEILRLVREEMALEMERLTA